MIVERDLAVGQHRNPDDIPISFTTAFFHLPVERGRGRQRRTRPVEVLAVERPFPVSASV